MKKLRKLLFLATLCLIAACQATNLLRGADSPVNAGPADALDFKFFKARVEPIFLKHRVGHARCYMCHTSQGAELTAAPAFLNDLSTGSTSWTGQQSRDNFQRVSKFVVPGKPRSSPLLMYPLALEEGGGREALVPRCGWQFESDKDRDWQTIAEWIRRTRQSGSLRK